MPSRSRAAGSQLAIHAPAPQKTMTMMANTRSRLTARPPESIDRHRELVEETGVDLLDDLDERRKRWARAFGENARERPGQSGALDLLSRRPGPIAKDLPFLDAFDEPLRVKPIKDPRGRGVYEAEGLSDALVQLPDCHRATLPHGDEDRILQSAARQGTFSSHAATIASCRDRRRTLTLLCSSPHLPRWPSCPGEQAVESAVSSTRVERRPVGLRPTLRSSRAPPQCA